MIRESIHKAMKLSHIKWGDADVFGEDSDKRRYMSESECLMRCSLASAQPLRDSGTWLLAQVRPPGRHHCRLDPDRSVFS